MLIIADSREQKVLDFEGIKGVDKVESMGLAYGDYSAIINGKPTPIVFERKSTADLFSTLTVDHDRFKREMERAKNDNITLILTIEGSYTDVWNYEPRGNFDGESMIKLLSTMLVKYDMQSWFCESRRVMARRIVDTFLAIERSWLSNVGGVASGSPETREEGEGV